MRKVTAWFGDFEIELFLDDDDGGYGYSVNTWTRDFAESHRAKDSFPSQEAAMFAAKQTLKVMLEDALKDLKQVDTLGLSLFEDEL